MICPNCQKEGEFYLGHRAACKACVRARRRRHYRANRERTLAVNTAYRANNHEFVSGCQRKWRQGNRERYNARQRAWRAGSGRESYNRSERRRELLKQIGATEESAEYAETVLRFDPCSYCGRDLGDTIDHIVSLSTGGTGAWDNLTAACQSCNSAKGARPLLFHMFSTGAAMAQHEMPMIGRDGIRAWEEYIASHYVG